MAGALRSGRVPRSGGDVVGLRSERPWRPARRPCGAQSARAARRSAAERAHADVKEGDHRSHSPRRCPQVASSTCRAAIFSASSSSNVLMSPDCVAMRRARITCLSRASGTRTVIARLRLPLYDTVQRTVMHVVHASSRRAPFRRPPRRARARVSLARCACRRWRPSPSSARSDSRDRSPDLGTWGTVRHRSQGGDSRLALRRSRGIEHP